MLYLMYLEDAMAHFSFATKLVVFGFSLISMFFLRERIGLGGSLFYFPVMVICAFVSNYLFWSYDVFNGAQDAEAVFSATIVGMIVSLIFLIVFNRVRDHYSSIPVRFQNEHRQEQV